MLTVLGRLCQESKLENVYVQSKKLRYILLFRYFFIFSYFLSEAPEYLIRAYQMTQNGVQAKKKILIRQDSLMMGEGCNLKT